MEETEVRDDRVVLECELPKKSDNEKKSDTDINLVRCDKEYTVEDVTNADMGIGSASPITTTRGELCVTTTAVPLPTAREAAVWRLPSTKAMRLPPTNTTLNSFSMEIAIAFVAVYKKDMANLANEVD